MTENQTMKPARPRWANALIIAALLFGVGLVLTVTMPGTTVPFVLFGGAVIVALIAGILALMKVRA